MRLLTPAVSALAAAMSVSQGARADACQRVDTTIVTTFFVDGCESPVGICTAGVIPTGPLKGTTRFMALTMKPGPSPDVILYTGELVITTRKGDVTIHDSGMLDGATGVFFEFQKVVGGTHGLKHAKGAFTSQGTATGTGFSGSLRGVFCPGDIHNPDHDHDDEDHGDDDGSVDHDHHRS